MKLLYLFILFFHLEAYAQDTTADTCDIILVPTSIPDNYFMPGTCGDNFEPDEFAFFGFKYSCPHSQFKFDLYHLRIYNRWGEMLFETYDINTLWDGTFNGQLVQDGTYTWILEIRSDAGLEITRIPGHINVIK